MKNRAAGAKFFDLAKNISFHAFYFWRLESEFAAEKKRALAKSKKAAGAFSPCFQRRNPLWREEKSSAGFSRPRLIFGDHRKKSRG